MTTKRTVQDILDALKITGVDPSKTGRQYTTCPSCSDGRHGFNRKAKCLAVNIDNLGAQIFCNHCDAPEMHRGYLLEAGSLPARQNRPAAGGIAARAMPSGPTGYAALHKTARSSWGRR